MDKNQLKHIIKEEYHNVKSFMEDKYGFTPELGQVISNPYAKSFVNEVQEPEVISQLRNILKNKQNAKIKDPKSGKMMRVDSFSASAVIAVYDAINDSNKKNFAKLSLPKMVNVAFKVAKVRKENVAKNHDGKAAPYGSGYKKVNENEEYVAYATKGKKVVKTIRDSEYNDDLFSKFKKDMERKGLDVYIDLVKNRKVVRQVYRTNESVNEAKYKHTYKSITDQQKDLKRIFPSGHPRVSVKAYHDMNPQGKMKTSYVEIEGPSSYVDAYKKMAFNGKGTMRDVIKSVEKNESVNEATFVPVSGTKAGGYLVLNNRKYQLKKDIKDVQIGNNYIVTLPKGTIIYNLPGGVLASHKSLEKYDSSSNRYFKKSDYSGIGIRQFPRTIKAIEKHSKILESVNEGYGPFIKAKNLNDIIKLSKQKKNATFYVTDDNNSRIGAFYLKNGKFAKATTANANYDFQKNKTNLKDRSDVIYKYKIDESVNEAYIVLYAPKKGVKPVTTAAYKDKKDAEKWAKDLGGVTMIVKRKVKGIDEGKKRYYQKDGIGKAKYTISYHDGKKTHKDGSDFFDIQIFKNKKDLAKFVNALHNAGYVYGFNEGIKEGVFSNLDLIRQNSKDARDFIKNVFKDDDFKDMKNDREFLKYLKSIYEGFASDAQRRAAFASGYKAKGKKGKKESIEEYDVENYQDVKEFVEFMKEYKSDVNEAEYQGRDVKLGKIMQGDVKKFKVYVKNPKGNVVKVNFGHKGKGGEKTMRIKKSDPERRKAFRARHNCDNPGPRHKARYWACRTW